MTTNPIPERKPTQEKSRTGQQSAPSMTPEQAAAVRAAEQGAEIVRKMALPACMAGAAPLGNGVGASAFRIALDRLIEEAGNPSDPIEIMLIEQLAFANFRIGQLHVSAEAAQQVDAVAVYSSAAARLTGEFRRLALAIRHYREPSRAPSFTVVKQQNLSTGDQQVAYVEGRTESPKVPFSSPDTELTSKGIEHAEAEPLFQKSPTSRGRKKERVATRTSDTGRS